LATQMSVRMRATSGPKPANRISGLSPRKAVSSPTNQLQTLNMSSEGWGSGQCHSSYSIDMIV
jgi:hypothetical protein